MINKIWRILLLLLLVSMTACAGQANSTTAATTAASAPAVTDVPAITAATSAPAQVSATPDQSAAAVQATVATQPAAATGCTVPAALTPAMTEGPYFKSGSPERASLIDNLPGTKLILTGYVLSADCTPIPHALLDFWQADSQGQYDNSGYTLRGHQFTDAAGHFQLETVVPGLYPGRTEHIHVKVQAPNGPILTTQLFFPGVSQNQSDSIYNPQLLINVQSSSGTMTATYNFIVATK